MDDFVIDGKGIREILLQLAARGNKSFTESLHPGVEHVLGIRIPDLRRLAQKIAKGDWMEYLKHCGTYYMEERLLHGLVLGYISPDTDFQTYLQLVSDFVKVINSWSVCDSFSFSGGKSFITHHEEELWLYVKQWMRAEAEYEIRFGVVMAKKYFVTDKYTDELLKCMGQIHHEGYYVRMAIAWTISECFIKYPERTEIFLHENQLDNFTYNKTLQKIIESYRVDAMKKKQIKAMKR